MLRIGAVGMGIGGGHGAVVHQSGVAELAAVCDRDPAKLAWRLETYEKELGLKPRGYTDFAGMLERERLDGVIISTPSGLHHQQAAAAARRGVHLLIDKPLDITAEHMDAIEQAVAAAGVLAGVNHGMRFQESYWGVKQAVEAGAFGRLLIVDARLKWFRDQAYYDKGGWRATWAMDGGGSLMNQGVHMIDMLAWLAGPARTVRASFAALNHRIETEDWSAGVVEFRSGIRSSFSTTTCAFPKQDRTELDIHGELGTARLVNGKVVDTNLDALKAPAAPPFPNMVLDFLDAIARRRAPAVPLEQARRPVELILAAYRSAREDRTISL